MTTKGIIYTLIILAVIVGGIFFLFNQTDQPTAEIRTDVENYIRENISELSPEKEVLGGKFYVTKITFNENESGRVEYEDGHIALVADFKYRVSNGSIEITEFEIVEPAEKQLSLPNYGLSFEYPSKYFLEQRKTGNGERDRYSIILTEDTEANRQIREGQGPPTEGPVSINIDIYQNNLDGLTAEQWIKNSSFSNFKLSPDEKISTTTVSGRPALAYRWSGLYEADNIVVATNDYIYSFVVTYIDPAEQIRKDFNTVLGSVNLFTPTKDQ